jgi:hypothetical protein
MGHLANEFPEAASKFVKGLLRCRQLAAGAADRKLAEQLEAFATRLESESGGLWILARRGVTR